MSRFTNDEKTDLIFIYAKFNRNSDKVLLEYSEFYPERRLPDTTYFKKLERNMRLHGTLGEPYSKTDFIAKSEENKLSLLAYYVNYKKELGEDVPLRIIDSVQE